MKDATREEVIDWCINNKVDFTKPLFPPPEGWMWFDTGVPAQGLTAIFTNGEYEDIESIDVFFKVAAAQNLKPDSGPQWWRVLWHRIKVVFYRKHKKPELT